MAANRSLGSSGEERGAAAIDRIWLVLEKRGGVKGLQGDFGMTMVRRLGGGYGRGARRRRVRLRACGDEVAFGAMWGRCEDGADGDEDEEETRWCGAGDTRKKTGEKGHGKKKCFRVSKAEFRKRKADSQGELLNLARNPNLNQTSNKI